MTPAPHLTLGLLLTAAAGFVDVVGFIELGGHFTSFMSGNTTQLGVSLVDAGWSVAQLTASLIALFFIGGFLGAWLALMAGARWGAATVTALVLLSFAITLGLAAAGFPAGQVMLPLAAGAGAQNAILPSTGAVRLGATFVTGTLFAAAQDLARAMRHLAPPWRWLQHLLVWLALLFGGLLGGLGYAVMGVNALLAPGLLYVLFLAAFLIRRPASLLQG